MPGTGACSIDEAVRLNKIAVAHGCGGVLMLPPFYYKGVSDDGLFAWFSEVVQRVGDDALKIYLYHIPPQTGTPFSLDLIGRLIKEYPNTVVGLKDSGGDWSNTKAILDAFPGFGTFAGSEVFCWIRCAAAGSAASLQPATSIRPVFARSSRIGRRRK